MEPCQFLGRPAEIESGPFTTLRVNWGEVPRVLLTTNRAHRPRYRDAVEALCDHHAATLFFGATTVAGTWAPDGTLQEVCVWLFRGASANVPIHIAPTHWRDFALALPSYGHALTFYSLLVSHDRDLLTDRPHAQSSAPSPTQALRALESLVQVAHPDLLAVLTDSAEFPLVRAGALRLVAGGLQPWDGRHWVRDAATPRPRQLIDVPF